MGYMTKKQIADQKKKLNNLRDDNTKLRRQLRDMSSKKEVVIPDISEFEKALRQAETTLTNTKAIVVDRDARISARNTEIVNLQKTIKDNINVIEDRKSSINKYRNLGFWSKIGMAFKSKNSTLGFFFD